MENSLSVYLCKLSNASFSFLILMGVIQVRQLAPYALAQLTQHSSSYIFASWQNCCKLLLWADLHNNGIVVEPSRECCLPDICIISLVNGPRDRQREEWGRRGSAKQCMKLLCQQQSQVRYRRSYRYCSAYYGGHCGLGKWPLPTAHWVARTVA